MSRNSSPDLQRFLDRLTLRSPVSQDARRAILDLPVQAVEVAANRDFVHLGDRVDHACLVTAGLAGRIHQDSDGRRQITAIHIPGDMADLHSVVQPAGSSALQALGTASILRVPHAALRRLAARDSGVAEAFWRDCAVDAAILSQWVVNVGRRDARARTAHLFCEMATRYGSPTVNGGTFRFPVTQSHLADALSLTPVHVNRTLMGLRRDRVLTVQRQLVTVHDWRALIELADFDPGYLHIARTHSWADVAA